jgi:hypothetical protein
VSLLTPQQYVECRQNYRYDASSCKFSIEQTGSLQNIGEFSGIFSGYILPYFPKGINLRQFENICQEVFRDCQSAMNKKQFSPIYLSNLKNISAAIVFWKMASQGGRAPQKMNNMLNKWHNLTANQLINAYLRKDIALFRIGGVLIPTASAFLRFLYPEEFGIIDSRVTNNYTQPHKITALNLRDDGYILNLPQNIKEYNEKYIPFLRNEAKWMNEQGITFKDRDAYGREINFPFRPCDIEMALFM